MTKYALRDTGLAIICGLPVLALLFTCLRIYGRRKLKAKLGWDDWLIVTATILSFALIGPSVKNYYMWHIGMHIWEVNPRELEPDYDDYYPVLLSFNLLNLPIVPLVKASIIMLLLRVGSVIPSIRRALYAILVFNVGVMVIPWCFFIFMCPPRTGNTWAPRTFGGLHCVGRDRLGEMLIFVTCANLLTDLLIFPIPFLIMHKMMNTNIRTRVIVILLFASSLFVTALGAAKIYTSYRDRLFRSSKPDWTYPIDFCVNHAENNVAIIVGCVPALRGLISRWVGRRGSSTEVDFVYGTRNAAAAAMSPIQDEPFSPRTDYTDPEKLEKDVLVATEVQVNNSHTKSNSSHTFDSKLSETTTAVAERKPSSRSSAELVPPVPPKDLGT
ncbi:hypothetical protein BDY21DRAFT_294755 [Lineolata rhizophorae]|uniref:Rhodopsin domain-containing protein n=1 Tax=Lineolata rhizophorae TaxID=578093 RepID=A0A6A6NMA3_9PEZI|nr:hypothetical protein BDY21DRAFT_294755 [Lineolata rhizophorae]